MRIALVTETFLPRVDGVTNTLRHVLEYLAKHGHESLLFAPQGAPSRYAHTPIITFNGATFPPYPEFKLISPLANLGQHFHQFAPDVVHVLNPISLGLGGIRRAKLMRIPVVASYHTDVPGFARQWRLGVFSTLIEKYLRWMHNQADLNLCPSTITQAQLNAGGYKNLKVWSRGVDTRRFHPKQRTDVWRNRLSNNQPNKKIVLFVGRLGYEKRIDWIRPVLDTLPQTCLAIVGDGPARAQLEAVYANAPVVFTGALHNEELAHAYAAADCFVFPSANETFGNVALEAMASGLPVVAARAGGLLDFCQHGRNALLFSPDNKTDLVARVSELMNRASFAHSLGEQGRLTALSRTWERVLDTLLEDYRSVIAHTHKTARPAYAYRSSVAKSTPPN